jgi:ComF family protein
MCWSAIEEMDGGHKCSRCASALVSEEATLCGDCMINPPRFRKAICFGPYEDPLREAIHQLKFKSIKRLAKPLGRLLTTLPLPEADVIIPVPVGLKSLRLRGFNHAFYIAKELSMYTGLPVEGRVLYKKKETPPQVGLSAIARKINLRGAFGMREKLSGDRVLLVDDVITTGSTMNECAKTLRKAGASEVIAVSLARA